MKEGREGKEGERKKGKYEYGNMKDEECEEERRNGNEDNRTLGREKGRKGEREKGGKEGRRKGREEERRARTTVYLLTCGCERILVMVIY